MSSLQAFLFPSLKLALIPSSNQLNAAVPLQDLFHIWGPERSLEPTEFKEGAGRRGSPVHPVLGSAWERMVPSCLC